MEEPSGINYNAVALLNADGKVLEVVGPFQSPDDLHRFAHRGHLANGWTLTFLRAPKPEWKEVTA